MKENAKLILAAIALLTLLTACSGAEFAKSASSGSSNLSSVNPYELKGSGSISVPTASAVVARVQNGLENAVSPLSGNFAKSLAQVKGNLPNSPDPTRATGFDQAQLLIYAACSDLTTGSTPKMKSMYNVDPKAAVSANQTALQSAGVRMLDNYVAKLASQGPTASGVNSSFGKLVQNIAADSGNTSTIAFMSVCIAANSAGATLMGF
jgi:hypothetical protein